MRIGIYDPYLDTMSGGEKYMLSALRCLAKNHEMTLFWDPSQKEDIVTKANMRFNFDLSDVSFVSSLFDSSVPFLTRFMESRNYDLILLLSDGSLPFLACPTIVHFQSPVEWVHVSLKTKIKAARLKRVICNSVFTKSYIDKKFGITSKVIYPPIKLETKQGKKKTNTILHVGRFGINHTGSSYKKQEVLIDSFKKMVEKGRKGWELSLVMSVREEDKDKLSALQDSAENYPIRFVINPENTVLWEEYEKAKLYWHASGFGEDLLVHPDRAEHFGMSTVEAMGMGAVPIVINAGGQKEIVQDGENGFVWDSLDELIEKTSQLMDDEKKRMGFSENGVKTAERYSLASFCQSISESV